MKKKIKSISGFFLNPSQLKKNAASGLIYSILNIILLLITYPIYLHFLGTELYGLWATLSVIVVFSQLGDLGINNAIMKFISAEYHKKDFLNITKYISTGLYSIFFFSFLLLIVSFYIRNFLINFLNIEQFYDIALLLIPLMVLLSFLIIIDNLFKGVLGGIGRLDIGNYFFIMGRFIGLALSIVLLMIGYGVWGIFFGVLISHTVSLFSYLAYIKRRKIKIIDPHGFNIETFKSLYLLGGTLTLTKILRMFLDPLNKMIISRYIGLSEVTFYEIAFKGIMHIKNIFDRTLQAIMPKFSALNEEFIGKKKQIMSIYKKSTFFVSISSIFIFLFLFLFTGLFIRLWLGKNFDPMIFQSFRILLIGVFFNILIVPAYYLFIAINRADICLKEMIIRLFVSLPLLFLMVTFSLTSLQNVLIIYSLSFMISSFYYWKKMIEFAYQKNTSFID